MTDAGESPAAERAGFTLRPLNEAPAAGLIDNQIRAAIRTARFVVADLTHDNSGAYFEAGFAEGLGVPVIYTCEVKKFREKKTHFDTNHMQTGELSNARSRRVLADCGQRSDPEWTNRCNCGAGQHVERLRQCS